LNNREHHHLIKRQFPQSHPDTMKSAPVSIVTLEGRRFFF
jgi:hypothetical protein